VPCVSGRRVPVLLHAIAKLIENRIGIETVMNSAHTLVSLLDLRLSIGHYARFCPTVLVWENDVTFSTIADLSIAKSRFKAQLSRVSLLTMRGMMVLMRVWS
jgi:hypothetical protein